MGEGAHDEVDTMMGRQAEEGDRVIFVTRDGPVIRPAHYHMNTMKQTQNRMNTNNTTESTIRKTVMGTMELVATWVYVNNMISTPR